MKYFFIFILTTIAFSQHQEYQKLKQNHLIVTASKTIKVQCDLVEFSFSTTGTGSTLEEAVEKAKHKTSGITTELIKLGLTKKNLSTSNFHSGENYDDKAFLSSKRDFKATISTKVSITDMKLAEKAIIAISRLNPDDITQLEYKLENKEKHELIAVDKATQKARKKAEQMAKSLGTQINGVLYVEETNVYSPNNFYSRGGRAKSMEYKVDAMMESTPATFYVQETEIRANVRVIFLLK